MTLVLRNTHRHDPDEEDGVGGEQHGHGDLVHPLDVGAGEERAGGQLQRLVPRPTLRDKRLVDRLKSRKECHFETRQCFKNGRVT